MHVVATNIILWLRTLFKEAIHEIEEIAVEVVEPKDGRSVILKVFKKS